MAAVLSCCCAVPSVRAQHPLRSKDKHLAAAVKKLVPISFSSFEAPDYPAAWERAGIEAKVDIKIVTGSNGAVASASVGKVMVRTAGRTAYTVGTAPEAYTSQLAGLVGRWKLAPGTPANITSTRTLTYSIGKAAPAAPASSQQFGLRCTVQEKLSVGDPPNHTGWPNPWKKTVTNYVITLNIDLKTGRWGSNRSDHIQGIISSDVGNVTFYNQPQTGNSRFTWVNRFTGTYTDVSRYHDQFETRIMEIEGPCTKQPFTAFPKAPISKF